MIGPLSANLGAPLADTHMCSRAGCDQPAEWALHWRNPKIHTDDRRKTWLACDEHESFLRDFLSARNFPLTVTRVSELAADAKTPTVQRAQQAQYE